MRQSRQASNNLFVRDGCDWSAKAVYAALENKGFDLPDLEKELGLKAGSMRNVFYRRCRKYERVIAGKIGVDPAIIWPSRYPASTSNAA
ncbi:transcriptional regulator [Salmonella enterica]|uniref:Transcriptional regulator n=1 Tax=Salmonella enterica TaxID=28901 RepID=A0A744S373_SALER|nr:transcriptional regulator [Salmonella enterica]ECT9311608.1 transcriptional regulator [Salmonella enterica subsp. enterica serovar Montevideo]EDQ4910929.1 transcriptional regulator [Salmonella enterica subsp. enterica serovar Gaminara]EAR4114842.1 transcriptional regulator [Salmonella enterica]EAS2747256.1 transcriptional regulator [Salmonella enterica]